MIIELDDDDVAALQRIVYATARDNTRPLLAQVQVHEGWALATDSYRAAVAAVDTDETFWLTRDGVRSLDGDGVELDVGEDGASWLRVYYDTGRDEIVEVNRNPLDWRRLMCSPPIVGAPTARLGLTAGERQAITAALRGRDRPVAIETPYNGHVTIHEIGGGRTDIKRDRKGMLPTCWPLPMAFASRLFRDLMARPSPGEIIVEQTSALGIVIVQPSEREIHGALPLRAKYSIDVDQFAPKKR